MTREAASKSRSGSLLARWRRNLAGVAGRLRRGRLPGDPARWLVMVAAGVVAVGVIGVSLDAVAVGWSDGLPEWASRFFQIVTRFGKSDWLLFPSGVLGVALGFGDWRRAHRVVAAAWLEIGAFAGVLFFAIALPGIVSNIIKPLVGRVRPNSLTDAAVSFEPLTIGYAHAAFPSGHATTAGSLAVLVAVVFGRWSIPIVVAVAVVALSRVMIGAHHLSDAVAGFLIGGGGTYVVIAWTAAAGLGFTTGRGGNLKPNLIAVRRVLAGPAGAARMAAGLKAAFRAG